MEWTFAIAIIVAVVAFVLFKRMSFISPDAARGHLAQGALVIDVRSPEEFRAGHLSKAVNIPLGELASDLPRQVKDKNQVLLLHCLSGGRSEVARHQLKRLGYPNAYNLGSFARAKSIVGE
ncbi:MAG: rhodanese-like domain-containing protein [Verrucomicrobiia bacterium]